VLIADAIDVQNNSASISKADDWSSFRGEAEHPIINQNIDTSHVFLSSSIIYFLSNYRPR